jgi:hydrogenase maturation protein HypF
LLNAYDNNIDKVKNMALSLGLCSEVELSIQLQMMANNLNSVTTTSAGRLFDAVSAMLDLRHTSTFEGEAAMSLEFAAKSVSGGIDLPPVISGSKTFVLECRNVIQYIADGVLNGISKDKLAYAFHASIADMILTGCLRSREVTHLNRVALSGGVFANLLLLSLVKERLIKAGFETYTNSQIPANDGGIAVGQAVIAINSLN